MAMTLGLTLASGSFAQTSEIQIDVDSNPDCRAVLAEPITMTGAAGSLTVDAKTVAGLPPECVPGAGASASLTSDAPGASVEAGTDVTLSWEAPDPATFDCDIFKNADTTPLVNVTTATGTRVDTPDVNPTTYRLNCETPVTAGVQGVYATHEIEVTGAAINSCGTPIPNNATRYDPIQLIKSSIINISGSTFEELFTAWPGDAFAKFTGEMGANQYMTIPFIPTSAGTTFELEQSAPSQRPPSNMTFTVSACAAGFTEPDIICSKTITQFGNMRIDTPGPEDVLSDFDCGGRLTNGNQYYLNIIFTAANGDNACTHSSCKLLWRISRAE